MTSQPLRQNTSADWERVQSLFHYAVNLHPLERAAFIEEQTSNEPLIRKRLLALLASDTDKRTSALSRAVGSALVELIQGQTSDLVGQLIGSYRLVSVLGQGGTGTVYLAERADRQYSAEVAVKIVDVSALQIGLGGRFRAERQILANLNHPNIARLFDAGETDSGQPYLVMEYVCGEPVDQYCDSHRLDLRQRLQLFADICSAVQYAHQNLIVHRDLKPANILVTEDGSPKLLDFGIAKLLHSEQSGPLPHLTRVADRLLTPEYASPEQILGGIVTTSSDVYSLGVVLYELVCGLRPYRLPLSASQLELERTICLSDPEKPSVAVTHAAACSDLSIEEIADARSLSAERLRRQLCGDIDAIVMRALRKEPQHRYGSVEQLVADIRRHLNSEPVHARQGNWLYYSQRFARRHTAGVAAGIGFIIFVIGVAVVMSVQRQQIAAALDRATQDGKRAEAVSEFMLDVFSAADPYVHFGREPTARNLLEQAASRIQTDLTQQPEVRARLLEAIGISYSNMGHSERALEFLEEAAKIQRQVRADDAKMGSLLAQLAVAQREAAKYEQSDRTFAEALQILRQSSDTRSEKHAKLLVDLARLEMLRGQMTEAKQYLASALNVMTSLRGPEDPEVAAILSDLANVLVWSNDLVEAERTAREAVRIYASVPESHPDRIFAAGNLARILMYRDKLDEAAPLFERVLSAQRFVYGTNNSAVADTLGNLAQLRIGQGKLRAAEELIQEALKIHEEAGGTVAVKVGYLQTLLATVQLRQQRYVEAESILRETLDLFSASLPGDHQYVASVEYYLGEALLGQRRYEDAEAVLVASMNRWKRTDAPEWRVARSRNALGEVLFKQGRLTEAERHLTETFKELALDNGADRDAKENARARVEHFYRTQREYGKLSAILHDVNSGLAGVK